MTMKKPDLGALITLLNTSIWAMHPAWLAKFTAAITRYAESGEWSFDQVLAERFSAKRAKANGGDQVAVVPVMGVISQRGDLMDEIFEGGSVSAEHLAVLMDQLGADETVGAVVLNTDSPGGRTGALELAGDAIYRLRSKKKVIAISNSMMASAAYWIGSAASEIVATSEADTGSIGVWTAHVNAEKYFERIGFAVTMISSGKYKTEGHPFGPLTDEAKAHIQSQCDECYAMFLKTVARNRGLTPAKVRDEYGEGRVLTAKEALKAGLVDRIATLGDVIGELQAKFAKKRGSALSSASAERAQRLAAAQN